MKKIYVILALLVVGRISFAQEIQVVDKTTRQGLPGVIIHTGKMKVSGTTDLHGKVAADPFKGADSLIFRCMGYETLKSSYAALEAQNFRVEMSERKITLEEVVVAANRWEEKKAENAVRIEKISQREVAFLNPQTSADMLEANGYVFIQKSQLAGGSPTLRGFATNRVLLVVDGVRMNTAIFRTGNLQNVISLDANAMESSEVLFGPGSVMYGSDAIGGVMDFHTLKPEFSGQEKLQVKGNVLGRFSSANMEKTGHVDLNIGMRKLAFATSFTYADYDDLRAGRYGSADFLRPTYQTVIGGVDTTLANSNPRLQVSSGFSQMNVMQKIRYAPSEHWDLEYDFHYATTSNAPRYDRLCLDAKNDGRLDYAEWYYGPQQWMMNRLGLVHSRPNALYNQLHMVVAWQQSEESRNDRKTGKDQLRTQTENVDALSVNLDFDKMFSEKISFFYGMEGVYNRVGSVAVKTNLRSGEVEPTTTRYPDGATWQQYGAYANLKLKVLPKLILNAGARYTHYLIKADFDTTMFAFPFTRAQNNKGAVNGSLGVVYTPFPSWQLYLNGSTGFRAPNVDDIGKVFESEPGAVVVPNADLKPEYAYNAEIGTMKTFGKYVRFDISGYFTLLDNALARRNFTFNGMDSIIYDGELSQVQAIQNISQAYVYGIQAGLDVSFGLGIGLSAAISWQQGQEQSEDSLLYYPLSHITPLFGNTHLTYERKKFRFDLYLNFNGMMHYEDLPLNDRNDPVSFAKSESGLPYVPAWYTLNFKGSWYINSYLALNLGIENITDQLYRPYSSGISAAGRNVIVALRCRF